MSGIVLIANRNGAPVDRAAVDRAAGALAHRGPDGIDVVTRGAVAIACLHAWTTPDAVGERQPLPGPGSQILLAFDGRLDNRADLLAALGATESSTNSLSDPEIVARSLSRWGRDAVRRLLGPFALVAYDEAQREVLCARDALGSRSLFYHLSPTLFVVASESCAVLTHPDVSDSVDEQTLAGFLAVTVPENGATFHTAVREILPAHTLTVGSRGTRHERFWTPDPEPRLRYRSDAEYAERFNELLRDAVRARLRAVGRPAVLMSGGLDSGSVAGIASEMVDSVRSVSWVFDNPAECDERHFIDALVRRFDLDATTVPGDDLWPLRSGVTPPPSPNAPDANPYRPLLQRAYGAAHDGGSRVLLTGGYADRLYVGADHFGADLLAEGRPLLAAVELARAARGRGLPLTYQAARRVIGRALGRRGGRRGLDDLCPDWLTEYGRSCQRPPLAFPPTFTTALRPGQHASALGAIATYSYSAEPQFAARAGVELRYPFRDRRLVEFMLAVPAHQLIRRGVLKHVLREAMRGTLPEVVRRRPRSTSLLPLFWKGLGQREVERVRGILDAPDGIWHDYVNRPWLAGGLLHGEGTMPDGPAIPAMWHCITTELWLRDRAVRLQGHDVTGLELLSEVPVNGRRASRRSSSAQAVPDYRPSAEDAVTSPDS